MYKQLSLATYLVHLHQPILACSGPLHVQAAHAAQMQELRLRAEVAEQLAARRAAEVAAAHERLRQESAQAAVSTRDGEPLEESLVARRSTCIWAMCGPHVSCTYNPSAVFLWVQTLQAAVAAQAKELQAAQQGRGAAEQQLAAAQQSANAQLAEMGKTAEALRNALEDQRADGAEALQRVQQELNGRLATAQQEVQVARAEAAKLGSELEEARAALEVQHAALQQQLERICADQEAQLAAAAAERHREQQRLAAALADAQHERQVLAERHGALQDFMEQQQEELAAARVRGSSSCRVPCHQQHCSL